MYNHHVAWHDSLMPCWMRPPKAKTATSLLSGQAVLQHIRHTQQQCIRTLDSSISDLKSTTCIYCRCVWKEAPGHCFTPGRKQMWRWMRAAAASLATAGTSGCVCKRQAHLWTLYGRKDGLLLRTIQECVVRAMATKTSSKPRYAEI